MTSASTSAVTIETLADLLDQLGGIAPERVRFRPAPGTATAEDVLAIYERDRRLYELLDVHFISSLPVMQRPACKVWADKRPVQIVWAVRSTRPDHDVVDDAFG